MSKISLESEILNRCSVEAVPGQVHTVEVDVKNPFDRHCEFDINIIDPDEEKGAIARPELILVGNSEQEWQYWHNKGLASKVADWGCVDAKKHTVRLDGGA